MRVDHVSPKKINLLNIRFDHRSRLFSYGRSGFADHAVSHWPERPCFPSCWERWKTFHFGRQKPPIIQLIHCLVSCDLSQYSPYFINALTNHIFFVVFVEYILDNILIFLHVFWEKKSIEVYGCSDPTSRSIILHTLGLTTRKNRFRRPLSQVTQGKHPV